ncbi:MAG: M23 family metallopeptidase [Elusimicrobia bacterium]|nr:M23 family metallopeptidase [Elusimicrobiota bacterium]
MKLLLALALALPTAAREDEAPEPETLAQRACGRKTVRITIDPTEPGAGAREDAHAIRTALDGAVKTKAYRDGSRTLTWRRGETTPAQCRDLLDAFAMRFPGRLRVIDPRHELRGWAMAAAGKRARGTVLKVSSSLEDPDAEPGAAPSASRIAGLFDGPRTSRADDTEPILASFAAPAASPEWRDALAGTPAASRYPSPLPNSFQRQSGAPPLPGATAAGESWTDWAGRGLSSARSAAGDAATSLSQSASDAYQTAGRYASDGLNWAQDNLLKAPLAHFTRITSRFGRRFHPIKKSWKHHSGVDYAAPHGTAVESAGDGVVLSAGWNGGYGKCITVRHPSGTRTLYGHLSSIGVVAGQRVTRGRVIGQVGSTGQSSGPHLHYEVRQGGVAVDPLQIATL